jgi:hypothetical protein
MKLAHFLQGVMVLIALIGFWGFVVIGDVEFCVQMACTEFDRDVLTSHDITRREFLGLAWFHLDHDSSVNVMRFSEKDLLRHKWLRTSTTPSRMSITT